MPLTALLIEMRMHAYVQVPLQVQVRVRVQVQVRALAQVPTQVRGHNALFHPPEGSDHGAVLYRVSVHCLLLMCILPFLLPTCPRRSRLEGACGSPAQR